MFYVGSQWWHPHTIMVGWVDSWNLYTFIHREYLNNMKQRDQAPGGLMYAVITNTLESNILNQVFYTRWLLFFQYVYNLFFFILSCSISFHHFKLISMIQDVTSEINVSSYFLLNWEQFPRPLLSRKQSPSGGSQEVWTKVQFRCHILYAKNTKKSKPLVRKHDQKLRRM